MNDHIIHSAHIRVRRLTTHMLRKENLLFIHSTGCPLRLPEPALHANGEYFSSFLGINIHNSPPTPRSMRKVALFSLLPDLASSRKEKGNGIENKISSDNKKKPLLVI